MGKIDDGHLSQDKHRSLMNQKIRIKNIIVSSSIIIALGLLVIFDHQRLNSDLLLPASMDWLMKAMAG